MSGAPSFRTGDGVLVADGTRLAVRSPAAAAAGDISPAMAHALSRLFSGESIDIVAEGTGAIERERQFAIRIGPAFRPGGTSHIVQGYFDVPGASFRVRRMDGQWLLTLKTGEGMARGEIEEPVEPQLGAALLSLAGPHTVEKKRHRHGGWEIDEYLGRHLGRAKAEYELDDEKLELPAFPPGIEVLREITGVQGFSDRALALGSRYPEL